MGNVSSCCNSEKERDTVTDKVPEVPKRKKKGKDIDKHLINMKPTPEEHIVAKNATSSSRYYAELENKTSLENVHTLYKFGAVVGHGKYGTVRLATPVNNPDKVMAVKSISLAKVAHELHLLKQEIEALR